MGGVGNNLPSYQQQLVIARVPNVIQGNLETINLHLVEIVKESERRKWKTKLCSDCSTRCPQQQEEQQEFYKKCKHSVGSTPPLPPTPTRYSEQHPTHYFKQHPTTQQIGGTTSHSFQNEEDYLGILMTHSARLGPLTRW